MEGYVSNPVFTRSNRSAQYCFINGRFVRDKVVLHATQQGYSHLLPKGQHPALFLYLTMDPKLLDVNVHPSKAEVRFAFQQDVHQFISRSIREALEKNLQSPVEGLQPVYEDIPIKTNYEKPFYREDSSRVNKSEEVAAFKQGDLSEALRNMTSSHGFHSKISSSPQQVMGFDKAPTPVSNLIYSEFEPLGQLNSSFIIMQGKKGLLVVDQHVAHERILYCLLYTSPSPRDATLSRMPSSA